jgi:hypothetical protein
MNANNNINQNWPYLPFEAFITMVDTSSKSFPILYIQGIACGPRCPLYLFFKKDAAAITNAAMPANKVRRSRHGFTPHHVSWPRNKSRPAE